MAFRASFKTVGNGVGSRCILDAVPKVETPKPAVVKEEPKVEPKSAPATFVPVVEDDEGFFSAMTGAVIGGGATSFFLALVFIAAIVAAFVVVRKRKRAVSYSF